MKKIIIFSILLGFSHKTFSQMILAENLTLNQHHSDGSQCQQSSTGNLFVLNDYLPSERPHKGDAMNITASTMHYSDFKVGLRRSKSFKSQHNGYPDDVETGKHIFSIQALGILKRDYLDPKDTSFAISYEQFLGHGRLAIRVPLLFGLHSNSFFISPMLKVYTGQQDEEIRFAFGPQLTVGSGIHNHYIGYSGEMVQVRRTQVGIMINHSLNATIANHFYVGLDLGLGIMVYNLVQDETDGILDFLFGASPSTQGGLSLGYRF